MSVLLFSLNLCTLQLPIYPPDNSLQQDTFGQVHSPVQFIILGAQCKLSNKAHQWSYDNILIDDNSKYKFTSVIIYS